jgi:plastocyanin
MKIRYLLALLVAFLLVGCAAQDPSGSSGTSGTTGGDGAEGTAPQAPAASSASVDVLADSFDPEVVTVKVGGTVTWTNTDTRKHLIAGPKRLFSETVAAGDDYSFTFEEAGEYEITDLIAPIFRGKVVVE